jgi:hypothetical protein
MNKELKKDLIQYCSKYKVVDKVAITDLILLINKAMELNKDKVFSLGQLKTAMDMARVIIDDKYAHSGEEIFQSLQQPKQIEVEVEMDRIPADLAPGGWDVFPKLDAEGCLILKKVL